MKKLCFLMSVWSVSSPLLMAQTLSLSPASVSGSITHGYYQGLNTDGIDSESFTFATPSAELVNFNTIQVTANAPAGEAWNIAYNGQGLEFAELSFILDYNTSLSSPYATIDSINLQFDFANGSSASSLGSLNSLSEIPNGGDRFGMDLEQIVTGNFSFTGFTATITYDNSSLAAAALSEFSNSSLVYEFRPSNSGAPDPGALMSLQAVPEPASMALISAGGLILLKLRRRRA